jgi:DNA-binding transcriptional ArsR family regulator
MNETDYRACRIFRALGNPLRYRLLLRLVTAPATPGALAAEFTRPLCTISSHLTILRDLDIVRFKPRPPYNVYSVKYDRLSDLLADGERFVRDVLSACGALGGASRANSGHASL